MKTGIGCLTFNRPAHIQLWAKQISELSEGDCVVHIANDTKERKGVAYRSNECLKDLYDAGCDYIFLFNDDCFPITKGWERFYIERSEASRQQHFIYQHETPGVKKVGMSVARMPEEKGVISHWEINIYDNCNGCMMFFTREVIEKVGGFSPNFRMYGMEHANYSDRIHRAGLTPLGKYSCPAGAQEYIYAMDIDNHLPFNKQVKHKGSMSSKEALFHAQKGMEVYRNDHQLYYPL